MADSRMIRRALLDSERVNGLDWFSQVFFFRLLLVADDFGLYDGRVAFMRAQMYGMCLERVREADLQRALQECERAGLIRFYEAGGKPYVMVLRYGQRCRKAPKYPLPAYLQVVKRGCEYELVAVESDNLQQIAADCSDAPQNASYTEAYTEAESKSESKSYAEAVGQSAAPDDAEVVERYLKALPNCMLKAAELRACAEAFFFESEAVGWTLKGVPVRDWRATARAYLAKWQLNLHRAGQRGDGGNVRQGCNNRNDYR